MIGKKFNDKSQWMNGYMSNIFSDPLSPGDSRNVLISVIRNGFFIGFGLCFDLSSGMDVTGLFELGNIIKQFFFRDLCRTISAEVTESDMYFFRDNVYNY